MTTKDIDRMFFYGTKGAPIYDKTIGWVAPLYSYMHDTLSRLVGDRIAGNRGKAFTILDVGCGTGAESIALLKKHPNVSVVVVDLLPQMLREFTRNMERQKIDPKRVRLVPADFRTSEATPEKLKHLLPGARTAGFDAVVSAFTLHHFSRLEKKRAYQRCFDCLGPKGVFLNGDLFNYEGESAKLTQLALEFDLQWIKHHHRVAAEKLPRNSAERAELEDQARNWVSHYMRDNTCEGVSRQIQMLRNVGFKQVGNPFRYWQVGLLWAAKDKSPPG